jgi:hypothetical protein
MEMRDQRIETEGYGRVSVTFRQEYSAEGGGGGVQKSSSTKTVWLEQGDSGWLIIKE